LPSIRFTCVLRKSDVFSNNDIGGRRAPQVFEFVAPIPTAGGRGYPGRDGPGMTWDIMGIHGLQRGNIAKPRGSAPFPSAESTRREVRNCAFARPYRPDSSGLTRALFLIRSDRLARVAANDPSQID
jgi:hypothetical protein